MIIESISPDANSSRATCRIREQNDPDNVKKPKVYDAEGNAFGLRMT